MKSQTEKITNEEIEYYYNKSNHSQYECAKHFGLSVGMFIRLLKERGIKKDITKHSELIKKKKLEKYGDENYNNREKAAKTCEDKYGVDNLFKDTDYMKVCWEKTLGVNHPMRDKNIAQKMANHHNYELEHKKAAQTLLNKTGYDNPRKDPKCIKKMLQTKINNGCFDSPGTSNMERRLEKILNRKFKNVVTKYRDERYARTSGYQFECDFYIPSEDLFIELNAHPTHSNHPYLFESGDEKVRESLLKSDKKWNKQLVETWAVRDVEKYNIAKSNNLNYIVLYPTNTIFNNKKFNPPKYGKLIEYLIKKLNKNN